MKVVLKDALVVLIPETEGEADALARWKAAHGGHVLHARADAGPAAAAALELHDLGPRADACREPINVVSSSPDPAVRLIGNLAATPFELDGRHYRSVESFWQGLKFPDAAARARIAECDGPRARSEGSLQGYGQTIVYEGVEIAVGTHAHWRLMERACAAKFEQNDDARAALLATGARPLVHIVKRDSRAIPA
jgi:hypothetical protein